MFTILVWDSVGNYPPFFCICQCSISHLYVLIPVLDDEKHYYVGTDEIEKLLRYGEAWLASHPQYEVITKRYLRHQSSLTQEALSRILADEIVTEEISSPETTLEAPLNLHQQRLNEVVSRLQSLGAKRILDLGCGEGLLLEKLLTYPQFTQIIGMDVSFRSLERAQQRLKRVPDDSRARLQLIHGSLVYDDTSVQAGIEWGKHSRKMVVKGWSSNRLNL